MQSAMPFVRLHQLTAMSSLAGAGRATEITYYFVYFGQLANLRAAGKMLNGQFYQKKISCLGCLYHSIRCFFKQVAEMK